MVEKLDSKALLGDSGPIAQALSSYEERTEQLEMAAAVEAALFGGHNLVVEAGTGVGKSFAYLVPAILAARRERMRVVVSTHTINLQEQLIGKDIPFLEEHLGIPFKAVLAKGRSNYLCIRRLYAASQHQDSLFEKPSSLSDLTRIIDWVYQTDDGSRTALEPLPSPEVWAKVCSDKTVCKGKRCKYNDRCFFQRARRALEKADIIVANHSLVFSDLALRLHDGPDGLEAFKSGFMPKYEALIFDEAHTIEAVAADNFGLDVSNFSVRYLLNGLYNPKTKKGFLTTVPDNKLRQRVVDLHKYTDAFYEDVADWLDTRAPSNGRMYRPLELVNSLSEPLLELRKALLEARGVVQTEEDRDELQGFADNFWPRPVAANYCYLLHLNKSFPTAK